MSNLFNSVLQKRPNKNAFNLSFDLKLSFKFGQLVPILAEEVVPGDTFIGNSQCMIRMAPMLAPVMHKLHVYTHYFYVPNRILWENWEDFITGNDEFDPPWVSLDSTLQPEYTGNGSLADYLGLPSSDISGIVYSNGSAGTRLDRQFNALIFAAYQRIWFEYYRDENLEFPDNHANHLKLVNGQNPFIDAVDMVNSLGAIRKRNWTKDYFTSALPFAQKGAAAMIPLSGDIGLKDPWDPAIRTYMVETPTGLRHTTSAASNVYKAPGVVDGSLSRSTNFDGSQSGQGKIFIDSSEGYEISGSNTTVEDLRSAFRLQEWLERNARGGTRYIESILSHFGERVRDYRLDRPEYLGGKKDRINISEVLQTSETSETGTSLATMAGHGIAAGYSGGYNYHVQEHGFIIGIMSVLPTPAYYQGVDRKFGARKDRLDYYWPTFAHLGEQEIQNKELFLENSGADETLMEGTFGYTPRYAEYRKGKSTVAGDFNTTLDFWHLARKFPTLPALNSDFINMDSNEFEEWDRIFAVQDGTDYFWAHVNHNIKAVRPMPRYATPIT